MAGVQTRSTNDFFRLVEGQTLFLYQVHEALQTHQRCVTLVAVIDILLDAEFLQCQHTSDTQQDLLLDTVLPVAAVELVGDLTIPLAVHLIIGV